MSEKHTTACGTEPFDKTYSLGYQVHHEDSPALCKFVANE